MPSPLSSLLFIVVSHIYIKINIQASLIQICSEPQRKDLSECSVLFLCVWILYHVFLCVYIICVLYVCESASIDTCVSVRITARCVILCVMSFSVCLSIWLCMCMWNCVCMCVCVCDCVSVCVTVCLCVWLSVYVCDCVSVCVSVCEGTFCSAIIRIMNGEREYLTCKNNE